MKNLIKLPLFLCALSLINSCTAQIKNAKKVVVKVDGNCEMCQETIEKAAYIKKISMASWNKDTKEAILTYDSSKTTTEEILKRIAYSGYDNQSFLAPEEAYVKLPDCCQYTRNRKSALIVENTKDSTIETKDTITLDKPLSADALASVFDSYFELKDALVNTDYDIAKAKAAVFNSSIKEIDMEKLEATQHEIWMKVYKKLLLESDALLIAKNTDLQRAHFSMVSEYMYEMSKVSKLTKVIYLQHCPMYNDGKGANWLSLENAVKNPYYGAERMSCGKTIEIIK